MSQDIEATIDQRPINATIGEDIQVDVNGAILQMNGLVDGDYGDIAVSNNGGTMTIENMGENATVTTGTYVSKVNQALLIKVRKSTAGTINKGQVVYIVGSTGTHLTVELARADVEATSAYTIGIAATTITGSNDGFVIQNGRLTGLSTLPTASFSDGDVLYLSETTAGGYRVGIPEAPNHGVFLGFVIRTSNGNAGELDVRIDNYQELEELSDVYVTGSNVNDFLVKKATRWENVTPANVKTILAINNVDNTSDLNKPISTATQTALDGKVSKTGDTINGVFQNSIIPKTQLLLTGTDVGNDAQGNPVSNTTPRIDLTTYQVSNYNFSDPDKGGYSELIRLKAGVQKAKPTLAYYDYLDKPVAWLVAHFQGQDLQRYATLANFPAVGVNDNLTGYFDISTNKYYRWDGTQYVELLPSDERYWYMAIHQHISTETADSTGSSNFTRLALQYGFDVIAIDTTNAHFRIKDGTFKNQNFGAFIIDSGKTYSKNRFDFFPSANTATQILNRNNGDSSTIFNQNTQSFRVELLPVGNANNPTATAQIAIATDNTTTRLLIPKNTIIPNHNLGIGLDAGTRLDVRHNLGNTNNTEYAISRISRDASSGFMQFGYIGNGTDVGSFLIRLTNSKPLTIGTTSNPTGFKFNNNGSFEAVGTITGSNLSGTNTGDQNTFSTIAVAGQSNVVADSTSDTLTLIAGSNITLTTNATNDSITIASTGGGGSTAETFETVSKNLKAYPASFNYTSGVLTSIVYTIPAGTITKTLNYTSGTLTSIVLSGDTPAGIDLTKTLGYTGDTLTSITYS